LVELEEADMVQRVTLGAQAFQVAAGVMVQLKAEAVQVVTELVQAAVAALGCSTVVEVLVVLVRVVQGEQVLTMAATLLLAGVALVTLEQAVIHQTLQQVLVALEVVVAVVVQVLAVLAVLALFIFTTKENRCHVTQ
jgi:hypothetical protein